MAWDAERLRRQLRVYAITPDTMMDPAELRSEVQRLLSAGVSCVQFRAKAPRPSEVRLACARAVLDACRQAGALYIINDDVSLALALDADGVHVGPEDSSVANARAVLGPHRIVGASAGSVDAGLAAVAASADYLGVGAIFDASASKTNASPPKGVGIISELRAHPALAELPLVAIGGIRPANAAACIAAGADGVASIRAAFDETDALVRAVRSVLQSGVDDRS